MKAVQSEAGLMKSRALLGAQRGIHAHVMFSRAGSPAMPVD